MHNLIKTEEFFKTIDLIITPVIIANKKTSHIYFNKAFHQEIGYTLEQVPNIERWFELAYPDPAYRSEIIGRWESELSKAESQNDNHAHLIARIMCANQSDCWYDIHQTVYEDYRVITFLNIDELADTLKQKDILLSILAHDVRSPLGNIRQIVNDYRQIYLSTDEIVKIFGEMGIQIDYIFNLINSLLVRTSADRGTFIAKNEQIKLRQFYSKYLEYYGDRLEKQGVRLIINISGEEELVFDPFVLDMISRNLIDNAIKYSPSGGAISINYERHQKYSEIHIHDEGPGMSKQQGERILNNQGSRRLKDQITDSFGLGLVMAKEILEAQGGKLTIDTKKGAGTCFNIQIFEADVTRG